MDIKHLMQRITDLEEENTTLKQEARTDRLTGISNLLALEEHTTGRDGFYVFADLDGLGLRNKTDGHSVVDGYIKEFGQWLLASTREEDTIACRQHGDEFMAWTASERGARRICSLIQTWTSRDRTVTCSAGVGTTIETADAACSAFKQQRKDENIRIAS